MAAVLASDDFAFNSIAELIVRIAGVAERIAGINCTGNQRAEIRRQIDVDTALPVVDNAK